MPSSSKCLSLFHRQLSSSPKLMQQYAARTVPAFRQFGQPQPAAEHAEESGAQEFDGGAPAPRFANRFNNSNSLNASAAAPAAVDASKPGINPFPEELTQEYNSPTFFESASKKPFSAEVVNVLQAELSPEEVEIKPDGAVYLPENRYRKILGKAFGPGGWCLVPRGAHSLNNGVLSREYALLAEGKYVSQARGHAAVMGFSNPALASEVVRSNALMRACKDLGVANELWDPAFVANWKANFASRRTENGRIRWAKKDHTFNA